MLSSFYVNGTKLIWKEGKREKICRMWNTFFLIKKQVLCDNDDNDNEMIMIMYLFSGVWQKRQQRERPNYNKHVNGTRSFILLVCDEAELFY